MGGGITLYHFLTLSIIIFALGMYTVLTRRNAIGNAFLGEYVLPFEVASLVLLAALVGAIVISRHETRE